MARRPPTAPADVYVLPLWGERTALCARGEVKCGWDKGLGEQFYFAFERECAHGEGRGSGSGWRVSGGARGGELGVRIWDLGDGGEGIRA